MFIHLEFSDGSNPYFFRGTEKEIEKELKRWDKNFYVREVYPQEYRLTERTR